MSPPANPEPWNILADIFGWTAFGLWSLSFYPQVYTNWKRKARKCVFAVIVGRIAMYAGVWHSVTGLSFDFELYNVLGFTYMLIYNSVLYWSALAKAQYAARQDACGGTDPQIQINDIAFAIHALTLTGVHVFQIGIYERGNQKFSNLAISQVIVFMSVCFVWAMIAASGSALILDILFYCSYVKLWITFLKYCSQLYLNWRRQSTVGWSVYNVLCDLSGGTLSLGQLLINCWVSDDWCAITNGGNVLKFGISVLVIFFDTVFLIQHYVWYRDRADPVVDYIKQDDDISAALLPPTSSTNVYSTSFGDLKFVPTRDKIWAALAAFASQERAGSL